MLKELFLLTKDGEEYMPFLNQQQPPTMSDEDQEQVIQVPILTESELARQKAFVESHQFR